MRNAPYMLPITIPQLRTWRDVYERFEGCKPPTVPHTPYGVRIVSTRSRHADTIGGWFGKPARGNPGRMYIAITPDGRSHS